MNKFLLPVALSLAIIFIAFVFGYLQGNLPTRLECRPQVAKTGLEKNLKLHVHALSEYIGERHHENEGSLDRAAAYIHSAFSAAGLATEYQQYGNGYRNLVVTIPGINPANTRRRETILIGAHYDTVWLSAGADDNASGVAVLLELARLLGRIPLHKTLQFVAFTNEEQPFSETELMGSRVYIERMQSGNEKITAMYSLEMLGYFSDETDSQKYPSPLDLVYPDTGNFVAFVSNLSSGFLLMKSLSAYRQHSAFPVEGLVMSEDLVPDIRRSDHAQFWDAGIPALMLTDTAFYRNDRYHTVGDLARTLDYKKMAEFTAGAACMFANIAGVVAGEGPF